MQQIFDFFAGLITSLFVLILSPFINACAESGPASVKNAREYVGKRVEISIPECEELYNLDSHGGFHGDGETEIILQFTSENAPILTQNIKANEHWYELPMDWFIEVIFYGREYEGGLYATPFNCEVPEIHEGYWFVYNKQTKEYSLDYETYRETSSSNYYISVYDSEEMKLYFYNLDT